MASGPRRPRLRRAITWILAIGLAAYGAVAWIASSRFIHVRNLLPRRDVSMPGLTEVTATTDDGLTLRGSYVEPVAARGVVLVFHGIGGERCRRMITEVSSWGMIGVSFDFRGHGASDGDVTSFGWDERKDVAAVISVARTRWPGRKIAAWGVSLGGAALCYAADVVRELDAVVLESVYQDIDSAFERRVTTYAPRWIVPFTTPAKWLVAARLRIDPARLRPADFTARLRPERTLITTGEQDAWAGPGDLEALSSPLPGCKTHIVRGAQHHDVWKVGGEAYFDAVRSFMDSRMR